MIRVMLVDDSQKDVSPLKETLLAAGYDVIEESTSAAELLARVAAVQPDVIIIDSNSPTRDTLEQLSFVSAHQPRPIVLFTEDRANATIQAALKAGVSAYIVAGMQPERLQPIPRLRPLLSRRRGGGGVGLSHAAAPSDRNVGDPARAA